MVTGRGWVRTAGGAAALALLVLAACTWGIAGAPDGGAGGGSGAGGGAGGTGGGAGGGAGGTGGGTAQGGGSGAGGGFVSVSDGGYLLDPPDPCFHTYWADGCTAGDTHSAYGGVCQVASGCDTGAAPSVPKTYACPRYMVFADEMKAAARDDAARYSWTGSPFVYGVAGHNPNTAGLDPGQVETCCQCYQLIFESSREYGAPPTAPTPPAMIVQSFNVGGDLGTGEYFDLFMGAGGYGMFNACFDSPGSGAVNVSSGWQYTAFPDENDQTGGVKYLNYDQCLGTGGTATAATVSSATCQATLAGRCGVFATGSPQATVDSRSSCLQTNQLAALYHQNWNVRARKVACPLALTQVTGCRLADTGLAAPDPHAQTVATADGGWRTGFMTTTMQDCCKPACSWKENTATLSPVGKWNAVYSCNQAGVPITAP